MVARRQGTVRQAFNAKNAKDFDAESAKNRHAAEILRKGREVRQGTAETGVRR